MMRMLVEHRFTDEDIAELSRRVKAAAELLDVPGVGVVGDAVSAVDVCLCCASGVHAECTGFSISGDLCACPCRTEGK